MAVSCTRLPFGEAIFWGSCARWLGASVALTTPGRRRGPECAASTHWATAAALGVRASHQGPQMGPALPRGQGCSALPSPRVHLACLLETQGSSQGSGVILGVC